MILAWLLACPAKDTGSESAPLPACPVPANEAWTPLMEDEVRLSEADSVWTAMGAGTFDPAATAGCGEAPCLSVAGPVKVETSVLLNRGVTYRLHADVTLVGAATLRVEQVLGGGGRSVQAELALAGGVVDLDFIVATAGTSSVVSIEAEEGATVLVDGLTVTGPQWAEVTGDSPAPLRLGFLIHVEESAAFETDEAAWTTKAEVVAGLSALLARHGARLTVQPDVTFVRGAATFDPGWVAARAEEGMAWSAHLHDEEDGVDVFERAARDARRGFAEQGITLDDVNGGFGLGAWGVLADVGFRSMSAYKSPDTKLGLSLGYTTPWRPADGTVDEAAFTVHDPDGPLVFLPGMGTREVDTSRFATYATRILSQVRTHTRPDFVNVWYFIDHVDAYGPLDDPAALQAWIDAGGLDAALAPYETFLGTVVDPLVASGDVVYSTPSDMAFDFLDWERSCSW